MLTVSGLAVCEVMQLSRDNVVVGGYGSFGLQDLLVLKQSTKATL